LGRKNSEEKCLDDSRVAAQSPAPRKKKNLREKGKLGGVFKRKGVVIEKEKKR